MVDSICEALCALADHIFTKTQSTGLHKSFSTLVLVCNVQGIKMLLHLKALQFKC